MKMCQRAKSLALSGALGLAGCGGDTAATDADHPPAVDGAVGGSVDAAGTVDAAVTIDGAPVGDDPPALTAVRFFRGYGSHLVIEIEGSDPQGDVEAVNLQFLDDDQPVDVIVDVAGAAYVAPTISVAPLDGPAEGPGPFRQRIDAFMYMPEAFSNFNGVRAWAVDSLGNVSATSIDAALVDAPIRSGLGGACDTGDAVCDGALPCIANVCASPPLASEACAAVGEPITTSTSFTTTLGDAPGGFGGSCAPQSSKGEAVRALTLAATSAVVVTTSGPVDTAVYLRRSCADPATELACADDRGVEFGSRLGTIVPAGDYTLVIDCARDNLDGHQCTGTETVDVIIRAPFEPGETCSDSGVCADGTACLDPGVDGVYTCVTPQAAHAEACGSDAVALPAAGTVTIDGQLPHAGLSLVDGSCALPELHGLPDRILRFSLAQRRQVSITTENTPSDDSGIFDTLLVVLSDCEAGLEVACNDDVGIERLARLSTVLDAGTYAVVVDRGNRVYGSEQDPSSYRLQLTTSAPRLEYVPGTVA